MSASKDVHDARAARQHAMSFSSTAASLPSHSSHNHTVSLGSLNPAYRVNRRKSSSSMAGVNLAALAAAAKEVSVQQTGHVQASRPASQGDMLGKSSFGTSPPLNKVASAVVDGPSISSMLGAERPGGNKARIRRASEGTRLTRGERRRSTTGELRCETCGKGYKHGSCLTKHLWEHTPEWNLTSKLLISKHQQVQLLEAASVLVGMNSETGVAGNESAIQGDSDLSSDSPVPSGSSEHHDDDMSSRTSTPSQEDETAGLGKPARLRHPKRQDSYGSAYSHSTQYGAGRPLSSSSHDAGEMSYYRQWSSQRRPSTAGLSSTGSLQDSEEQADVAAAAEGLLSCSLGTPNHGPTKLPPDVPPVPPLPARFSKQFSPLQSGRQQDLDMIDEHEIIQIRPLTRSREDEDEGVFGRIEQ